MALSLNLCRACRFPWFYNYKWANLFHFKVKFTLRQSSVKSKRIYRKPCLCREDREHQRSLTCCNKDDAIPAGVGTTHRQRPAGGVAKPLHAAKVVRLLW